MHISLNLVLEHLSTHSCQVHIEENKKLFFERLSLLPEKGDQVDTGRLYVGELSRALELRKNGIPFYCVCIRDRVADQDETEARLSGLIVVNENTTERCIYNEMQELFYSVSEWVNQMNRYAYEQRPLQDILELSEDVIGNFISVSDSALSLVCYTRHIPTDDPLSVKLIANGFHPEETIDSFRENGLFELWDKSTGLIVNTDRTLSPYDLCSKVFKLHNAYYIHLVMTCAKHPLTPGLMDLFQMLVDVMDIYVERDWRQHNYIQNDYDSLLINLIENRAGNESVILEHAKRAHFPTAGPFQLCLIDFETMDKLPIGRIRIGLLELFPNSKVTIYQNRLILLFHGTDADITRNPNYGKLEDWLNTYAAACAVSCVFEAISDLRTAYEQTLLVFKNLRYIAHRPCESGQKSARISFYDNCFLLTMLAEDPVNRTMWRTTKYYRMLKTLSEHDEKYGTNNIQALYTFLFCDCRATEASKLLHMHRNNVLYRINKIEEMLGTSITAPELKRGLLYSYELLTLYGL